MIRVPSRSPAGAAIPGSATRSRPPSTRREHLLVFDRATELLGESASRADRAEGLRNACIQAAFHGDTDALSMDDSLATIDLTRPATSAFTGGIERDEMPDERVDQVRRAGGSLPS